MASVIDEPQMRASQRLLTAADLAALPDELPSGPVKYELELGRLVTLISPPGSDHGKMQLRVGSVLFKYAEEMALGEAFAEVAIVLRRNPDTVVAPDAAFVARRSLPVRTSAEGYLETIPDLVVEVGSKNDRIADLRAKAELYLKAGVTLVWVIDPGKKNVVIYRKKQKARELRVGDTLTAEGVIPGFRIAVEELFGA
jgi:Uma2 family endonuclease